MAPRPHTCLDGATMSIFRVRKKVQATQNDDPWLLKFAASSHEHGVYRPSHTPIPVVRRYRYSGSGRRSRSGQLDAAQNEDPSLLEFATSRGPASMFMFEVEKEDRVVDIALVRGPV